jgi:hypothetical protein
MTHNFNKILITLFLISSLVSLAACSYNFRAKGTPVDISITSIAIPLFESTSSDRGFEAEFTEIIRKEFIGKASIPVVSRDQAGAVLSGRIIDIESQRLTYNSEKHLVEGREVSYEKSGTRKLVVRLDITMTDSSTGKIIWHDGSMKEEAAFTVSDDPLQDRYNKEQAIKTIAELMAKKIYLNTMERF